MDAMHEADQRTVYRVLDANVNRAHRRALPFAC